MHNRPICSTCGTQFATLPAANACCPVCADERQYVGWQGQRWTDLAQLGQTHRIHAEDDAGLFSLDLSPGFAIGQRMALLPTPGMNLLWESLSLVTDEAVAALRQRGGADAIAISHPHFYAAMLEWSEALGDVPILLHEADRDWV
ncbi:MAG: MBL fold metallo-hydrolase, partial [Xanthomonadales bacterium]|nr:MBL fold metallo-hydrolase [Xanthomonadales bacterium]